MATTSTSTYSSPIQSSFTLNPLTTTFTPPATCTGAYYSAGVYVVGEDAACKPSGFADASTDYFSPGLACPSGYYTACHDNAGVASVTTVTCCPALGGVSLGCVTLSTLADVWATLFCTWVAPEAATTVRLTLSDDGTTSTVAASVSSPGGLNAQGIRMVYEATDLSSSRSTTTTAAAAAATGSRTGSGSSPATATATATSTSSSAASTSSSSSSSSAGGLSTGATAAIAVVVAVVGIGGVIGAFFWLRKRKQKQRYGATGPPSPGSSAPMDYKYTGRYDPSTTQELSGVGAHGVRNQQQELIELGPQQQHHQYNNNNSISNRPSELGSEPPAELPADNDFR